MARIAITVCDECRDPDREVVRYQLVGGGRQATLDLCEEHAAPLKGVLDKHGDDMRHTVQPRGVPAYRQTTMDDIEKLKR